MTHMKMDHHELLREFAAAHHGRADVETWRTIGRRHGYSGSALNGLFGGVAPSMVAVGSDRALTEVGWGRAAGRS